MPGFGLIQGDVSATLATLVVISIVITALLWAIDENQNVLASLVRKVLLVGFFAWLVAQWHTLSMTVVNGFAALGPEGRRRRDDASPPSPPRPRRSSWPGSR